MKYVLLISVLCLSAISVSAQIYFSTNLRTNYVWDEENDEWKYENQDEESLTFFEINKDFTLIKHTTSSTTSGYIIKSSEHDETEGRDQYIYMITSDVGNKYMMILDLKNDNIRFMASDGSFMIKHRIKSSWSED